jgi:hypothetical protein
MSEIVYLTHNNTIDLILKSDGVAQDLSAVTKITATFRGITITSVNKVTGLIKWGNAGYVTGEIRLDLGEQAIAAGDYNVPIVVYDEINTLGVVWGYIRVQVKRK